MITQIQIENKASADLLSQKYDNIDDMFDAAVYKLEMFKSLSLDNPALSYCLAVYADDIEILLRAIQIKASELQ